MKYVELMLVNDFSQVGELYYFLTKYIFLCFLLLIVKCKIRDVDLFLILIFSSKRMEVVLLKQS